ncbi:glycerate kinase [Halothermothrix orenii]|uniref:Glycerate kinase n=1 Tax=Halothermothrix orenii (strain H 168 / OCM 544 / DSM 9562) TaxID=373903 RepID=B8D188_HALOH|nr:glycerate kinase [Halothermothrix orenii]ACL71040.1 Glycerate kinase [Halothermothrix orenii H 168]
MKVLIAPDSFKGSLTALEVAESIERGIKKVIPGAEIIKVPMADGGEGTVRSLVDATGGEIVYEEVTGPLGDKVKACYGLLGSGETAVIEMATASGLPLVPPEQADPGKTTTYGTGELIKAALDKGVKELIIGIGGSATNDGGMGMAQALGVSFRDSRGRELGSGGIELARLEKIDLSALDSRIKGVDIKVACDVNNPLYGPDGAAYVYAPQKGADPEMVEELDRNLKHFAIIVKRELGIDLQSIPGAGAAGGLGAGLVAFTGAELRSGVEIVMEANHFTDKLNGVDLVITGEGKIDGQTITGKTPIGVARKAKERGIPVIGIAGTLGDDADLVLEEGIDAIFSIMERPVTLKEALKYTETWLESTAASIMRLIKNISHFY